MSDTGCGTGNKTEERIEDKDVLPYNFFAYNGIYTGSLGNMRYRIWRTGDKPDTRLAACAWPGPLAYPYAADEDKETEEFEDSEAGRLKALEWLNERFQSCFCNNGTDD